MKCTNVSVFIPRLKKCRHCLSTNVLYESCTGIVIVLTVVHNKGLCNFKRDTNHKRNQFDAWLYLLPEKVHLKTLWLYIYTYINQQKWSNKYILSSRSKYIHTFDHSVTPSLSNFISTSSNLRRPQVSLRRLSHPMLWRWMLFLISLHYKQAIIYVYTTHPLCFYSLCSVRSSL